MSDLGPMAPCPNGKKGQHNLCAVIPDNDDNDLTLFCDRCGMVRRMPVNGALSVPLDDLDAKTISALVKGDPST